MNTLSITPGTNNVGAYINNINIKNLDQNQTNEIKRFFCLMVGRPGGLSTPRARQKLSIAQSKDKQTKTLIFRQQSKQGAYKPPLLSLPPPVFQKPSIHQQQKHGFFRFPRSFATE